MGDFFRQLFDADGFTQRGNEPGWSPQLVQFHLLCDLLIAGAFLVVFGFLVFLLLRQGGREMPKRLWLPVLLLAVAGLMHLMEVWHFMWPAYRFAAVLKLVAAVVS